MSDNQTNDQTARGELWREHRRAAKAVRGRRNAKFLGPRAKKAMREMKEFTARGHCMGRRKIVSMQECADAGLVKPILVNGMIADWQLTPEGEAWDE